MEGFGAVDTDESTAMDNFYLSLLETFDFLYLD